MMMASNFVDNYCKQTVDGIASIDKLYKTYKEFCEYNGYTAMVKRSGRYEEGRRH